MKTASSIWGLLLFSLGCFAQQYSFKKYTAADGLASSTVYYILQDKKGFIWFATETGVSRFDGLHFKNYSTKDGLGDNTVLSIYEDGKGILWFITLSGNLYFLQGEKFRLLDFTAKNKNISARSIAEDKNGDYWINSYFTGLLKIKMDGKGEFRILTEYVSGEGTSLLTKDSRGNIHAFVPPGIVEIRNDSIFTDKVALWGADDFRWLSSLKNGNVIFGNHKELFLKSGDGSLKKILEAEKDKVFQYIYVDKQENIWVATNQGIINLGNDLSRLQSDNLFFKNKYISGGMLEDREGNFWIATLGQGVFFIPNKEIIVYTMNDGLADNKINAVKGDREGNIWLGANNGKVNQWKNGKLQEWNISLSNHQANRVTVILEHSDGSTWIGKDDGIIIFKNNKIRKITSPNLHSIKCITEGRYGSVWVGTAHHLIHIKDSAIVLSRTTGGRVTAVYLDFEGNLWFCEDNRLFRFDGANYEIYNSKNSLLSQRAYYMAQSADSTLWIATQGAGLVFIKNSTVKNIAEKNGLASDICNSLFIDDRNKTIWTATNKGLSKIVFQHDTYKIKNYTTVHGLISNEINSVYKRHDTLWLATNDGICFFDEKKLKINNTAPPVYFTSLQIMYQDSPLHSSYNLPYDKSTISIEYVGLAYRNVKSMKYKYRMSGIDTGWLYASFPNVQYPVLPPGDYTFMVSAANEDGRWSENPATLHFIIQPPYWETWWFRIAAFIMLIAGTASVAYWRINKIRGREKEKTALNQKIAASELSALRAQMHPHFIFNSLASIQQFIYSREPNIANNYLAQFSKLIRMILEHSQKQTILIADDLKALELYLKLEQLRLGNKFEYVIQTADGLAADYEKIPPLLIQPYVENAIWHGISHLENRKGKIEISLSLEKNCIKCMIKDNGIGRAKSAKMQAQTKAHPSKGMSITKDRLEILNSLHGSRSTVEIIDLMDSENLPAGTEVRIFIPVKANY